MTIAHDDLGGPRLAFRQQIRRNNLYKMIGVSLILCVVNPQALTFAHAETIDTAANSSDHYAGFIATAAKRFDIPQALIRQVIAIESAGNAHAISPAGAKGRMQIMPPTWQDMRLRYQLGDDPFDEQDNIYAGTAYLKILYNRFGSPGFLFAYNAGPARYQRHVDHGDDLPRETVDYVNRVTSHVADIGVGTPINVGKSDNPPNNAPLFAPLKNRVDANDLLAAPTPQSLFIPQIDSGLQQ